jgi:hypothetical protein
MRDPLTLTFNAPEDGSGDQSSWPRIWVARGGLAALIDDERCHRTILSGRPIIISFEDEGEGRFLEQVISIMLERRRCRRPAVAPADNSLPSTISATVTASISPGVPPRKPVMPKRPTSLYLVFSNSRLGPAR